MHTKVPVDVLGSAMQGLWRAQPMTGRREGAGSLHPFHLLISWYLWMTVPPTN